MQVFWISHTFKSANGSFKRRRLEAKSGTLNFQPIYRTFCSTQTISRVKSHSFPMPRTSQNCKLLIAPDFINNISFLIDTGSSYSLIRTSKRESKTSPDPTALYSATSNVIQTFGKQTLKINFNSSVDYTVEYFRKNDINFSITRLDFELL